MKVLTKQSAPRYERNEGIASHLLASPLTCDAAHLTTSVVEIEPGGHQRIHQHPPEQVYYVLDGSGLMTVGDETERVGPGDCPSSRRTHHTGCATTVRATCDTSAPRHRRFPVRS